MRLNAEGRKYIKTFPGALISISIAMIVLGFTMQKLFIVFSHANPVISFSFKENSFDAQDAIDLRATGFKMAFGVGDFYKGGSLDDPNHVRWEVKLIMGLKQKQLNSTSIPYHKCTQEDYDSFYPPAKDSEGMFENAR